MKRITIDYDLYEKENSLNSDLYGRIGHRQCLNKLRDFIYNDLTIDEFIETIIDDDPLKNLFNENEEFKIMFQMARLGYKSYNKELS